MEDRSVFSLDLVSASQQSSLHVQPNCRVQWIKPPSPVPTQRPSRRERLITRRKKRKLNCVSMLELWVFVEWSELEFWAPCVVGRTSCWKHSAHHIPETWRPAALLGVQPFALRTSPAELGPPVCRGTPHQTKMKITDLNTSNTEVGEKNNQDFNPLRNAH